MPAWNSTVWAFAFRAACWAAANDRSGRSAVPELPSSPVGLTWISAAATEPAISSKSQRTSASVIKFFIGSPSMMLVVILSSINRPRRSVQFDYWPRSAATVLGRITKLRRKTLVTYTRAWQRVRQCQPFVSMDRLKSSSSRRNARELP